MSKPWEAYQDQEATSGKPWLEYADEEPRDHNTIIDDIAAYGQIAAESVSMGLVGDELAAAVRSVLPDAAYDFGEGVSMEKQSTADAYEMYKADARGREEEFRRENKALSIGTDIAGGLLTGLGVAGKVGTAATRYGNIARQGAAGAVEGGVHGAMEGEDLEGRLKGGALMGGIGLAAGGLGGSLMRGQNSIDELADIKLAGVNASDDSASIAGREGFVSEEGTKAAAGKGRNRIGGFFDEATMSLQDLAGKRVSQRFGSLLNRADGDKMRIVADVTQTLDSIGPGLRGLDKVFKSDAGQDISLKIMNAGAKNPETGASLPVTIRKQMLDEAAADLRLLDEGAADVFDKMRLMTDDLAKADIGNEATGGFFPRRVSQSLNITEKNIKDMGGSGKLRADRVASSNVESLMPLLTKETMAGYRTPVASFMDYMEDVASADSLNRAFGLDITPSPASAKAKTSSILGADGKPITTEAIKAGPKSNILTIKKALRDKMKKEGASESNIDQAEKILDSFSTNSRVGPNPILQTLRTATSAALLGTPENAVLQLGDLGVAGYQSGLLNAAKSIPRAIRSMIMTDTDKIYAAGTKGMDDFIRAPDLGITRQFLGELKREGDTSLNKVLDFTADKIMTGAGVRKVNRLGQEVAVNAAWKRATAVAMKDPSKLADLPATRGWSQPELDQLAADLVSGEKTDLLKSYLFTTLTDIQPVSASALPLKYADHPNGRVLYAMKTYMLKQMNIMRTDIGGKYKAAEAAGLQTPEGRKLFKEASIASARYVGMVAGVNAFVEAKRKIPRTGEDNYEPVRSTGAQLVSNATSGFVDINAKARGGDTAQGFVPPAIKAVGQTADAMLDLALDQDPDAMLKVMGTYMPVGRQAKWIFDVSENL